jgi:hypothetical protein
MRRRLEITDMPIEIHLAIIQSVLEDPPEIKIQRPPEVTYLNRFTPPAKTLRRVCQRWKALIDQPSTYSSRLTTAILIPDAREDGPDPVTLEIFRFHLQHSNSLLAVRVVFYPPFMFPIGEIHRLLPFGDRLIKLEAYLQNMSLASHILPLLESFKRLPRLFDLTMHDVGVRNLGGDDSLNVGLSEATATSSTVTFSEICQSLPSLRKLNISSFQLEDAIHIPSDLTSLKLNINFLRLSTFLPSLCTSLRELNLNVHTGWSAEGDKSIFPLDSLVSLDIKADSQGLIDVLCRFKCPRLEHVGLKLIRVSNAIHSSETDSPPTSTQSIKTLRMEGFPLSLFWIAEVIGIPEVLERLTVVSIAREPGEDNTPDNRFDSLKRMKSHTLDIISPLTECSRFLGLYASKSIVQQLRLILHGTYTDMEDQNLHFEARFPSLQSLTLSGDYTLFTLMMIDGNISTGSDLHTLAFDPLGRLGEPIGQLYCDIWHGFASDAASRGTYSSVTTLTVPWPSAEPQFLSSLFRITPNIRTLIIKVDNYDDWTIEANSLTEYFRLLESLVVEGRDTSRWTYDDLENARPKAEAAISGILARRDGAGAPSSKLRNVILRSFSEWDVVEVRSYPQECGVLLQLEAAINDGDRRFFNRL